MHTSTHTHTHTHTHKLCVVLVQVMHVTHLCVVLVQVMHVTHLCAELCRLLWMYLGRLRGGPGNGASPVSTRRACKRRCMGGACVTCESAVSSVHPPVIRNRRRCHRGGSSQALAPARMCHHGRCQRVQLCTIHLYPAASIAGRSLYPPYCQRAVF